MLPGASVSGYYFWHPEAAYFGLGRIGRDQLEDYAAAQGHGRRGWPRAGSRRTSPRTDRTFGPRNRIRATVVSWSDDRVRLAIHRRLAAAALAGSLLLTVAPGPAQAARLATRSISAAAPTSSPRRISSNASGRASR